MSPRNSVGDRQGSPLKGEPGVPPSSPTHDPVPEEGFHRDPAGHPDHRKTIDLGGDQRGTVLGAATGDHCEHCGSDGEVLRIQDAGGVQAYSLHFACAAKWFKARAREPS